MGMQLFIVSEVDDSAYNGIHRMLQLQYLHKNNLCNYCWICFPFIMPYVIIILVPFWRNPL